MENVFDDTTVTKHPLYKINLKLNHDCPIYDFTPLSHHTPSKPEPVIDLGNGIASPVGQINISPFEPVIDTGSAQPLTPSGSYQPYQPVEGPASVQTPSVAESAPESGFTSEILDKIIHEPTISVVKTPEDKPEVNLPPPSPIKITGTIDPYSSSNICFTHTNPSQGLESGRNIIDYVEYETDGNYKMEITIHAWEPIVFGELRAGKCGLGSQRGLDVINEVTKTVKIRIELQKCQMDDDYNLKLLRSIDSMNQPILIEFVTIKSRDKPDSFIGHYKLAAAALYHEDYILDFNTESLDVEQTIVIPSGDIIKQANNLQFTFMTFTDQSYEQKTYHSKSLSPPDWPTFLEITPTNGFNPDMMASTPELCFLRDITNNNMVLLWDMQKGEANGVDGQVCVPGLRYMPQMGQWRYTLNFNQALGYSQGTTNHNKFQLTCNLRVCANVFDNPCQNLINVCNYII